jgi:GNAT superfamily N-acetyltransferase
MRLLRLREHQALFSTALEMLCDEMVEQEAEIGKKESHEAMRADAERQLRERLIDSDHEFFLFEKGRTVVGFAEVVIEEECFPDEDLPETCVKILSFYITPQERRQKIGSAFFKLIRDWGRDQEAALIEVEVSSYPVGVNKFLTHQGLELVGAGAKNCYRSFI